MLLALIVETANSAVVLGVAVDIFAAFLIFVDLIGSSSAAAAFSFRGRPTRLRATSKLHSFSSGSGS